MCGEGPGSAALAPQAAIGGAGDAGRRNQSRRRAVIVWVRRAWDASLRAVGVMDRTSERAWAEAETLQDAGELTAQWLEGELPSRPGYAPGVGPDRETQSLIPSLAAANRAGFVTHGSQPGCDGIGYDGQWWSQHAAVEGFADDGTLARLQAAVEGSGLRLTYGKPARFRTNYSQNLDGMFGAVLSRSDLSRMYAECGALDELRSAWQVCVQDPQYGESTRLWAALDRFSGRAPGSPAQPLKIPPGAKVYVAPLDTPPPTGHDASPSVPWTFVGCTIDPASPGDRVQDLLGQLDSLRLTAAAVADRLQAAGVAGPLPAVLAVLEAVGVAHQAVLDVAAQMDGAR